MKHSVLPQMTSRGALKSVSFATIDTDREMNLARQLMRGGTIPQLIAFSRTADGQWHREQITGATSEAAVAALVERARKNQQPLDSTPAAVAADDYSLSWQAHFLSPAPHPPPSKLVHPRRVYCFCRLFSRPIEFAAITCSKRAFRRSSSLSSSSWRASSSSSSDCAGAELIIETNSACDAPQGGTTAAGSW
jgi:hypothetical protein